MVYCPSGAKQQGWISQPMNEKLPDCVVRSRKLACSNCTCEVNFADPCARCPRRIWDSVLCYNTPTNRSEHLVVQLTPQKSSPPSFTQMARSAAKSATSWVKQGVPIASEELLKERQAICKSCEFWDSKAFKGTGRCMKCGCSTWAKLRMATEKCPIGKW